MSSISEPLAESDGSKNTPPNQTLQKLEERLSEVDPKLFEGIPKEKKKRIVQSIAVFESRIHTGPVPDPETLAKYSNAVPDGAERILRMAEKQQDHRIALESDVVCKQLKQSGWGQIFAFVIAMSSIGCATYCVVEGQQWGVALGVGGLTGLVSAFIQGKRQQQKNLENKRPTLR